jgi:hypothetical protein
LRVGLARNPSLMVAVGQKSGAQDLCPSACPPKSTVDKLN